MPRIDKEHTEQFYINVNNIVRELLKRDILFYNRRAKDETIKLIKTLLSCEDRQAKLYLKEAKKEILRISEVNKKDALNEALRDRHFLILQAKVDKDYKLAHQVMIDRDKLKGLYEEKITHSGEVAITFIEKLDE